MHPFDLAPGLDEAEVDASFDARPRRVMLDFLDLKTELATHGPEPYREFECGTVDDFITGLAIPLANHPGQWLRCAFDSDWQGFWYLGLGSENPACDEVMSEIGSLLLGA